MSPRVATSRTSRLLVSIAGVALVIYLALLLGTTFHSQRQLHIAAHESLHSELQKRASALSYFYSERRADISRLAQERALTVFFSNRALGMSMEYGLRTSLEAMRGLVRTMVSTRLIDRSPIYKRIVIQDVEGAILVDEGEDAGKPAFWGKVSPTPDEAPALKVTDGSAPKTYLIAAVSDRDLPVALIVAEIAQETVIDGLVRHQGEQVDYSVNRRGAHGADCDDGLCADGAARRGSHHPTRRQHTEPIAETPFEIEFVGNAVGEGGILASESYLYALMIFAAGLLALLGVMVWQIRERELDLIASRDELAESNDRLRKSQRQLVQSEKMASLGTLAAGVAHEINNPIGFIQGNLVALRDYQAVLIPLLEDYRALVERRGSAEPALKASWSRRLGGENLDFILEDLRSLVDDSAEGASRVAKIVAGLRSFTRGGESQDAPLELNECVAAALGLAGNELKYKAEIELDLGDLPLSRGNHGQITQVLVNLLVNAAQAIEGQGRVRVETRVAGSAILLKVADTGRGIAPEHLDQIFTPFFTTKDVGTGTGLGLSISQGIIESHGGSIQVRSQVGSGSVFTIVLPIETEAEQSETAQP